MSERVKYDTEKEFNLAWLELDKLPVNDVTDISIRIIARNHAPTSSKQVMEAYNEMPGLLFKPLQDGALLIDSMCSGVAQHLAEQLSMRFQEKLQMEQMEALKPKLELAPAGAFAEMDEVTAKRMQKAKG